MWMPVPDFGQYGVNRDIASHLLPPGAWSNGSNVRFRNGRVFRNRGSREVFPAANLLGDPYWGVNIDAGGNSYWVYASLNGLFRTLGAGHTVITRSAGDGGAYAATADNLWNGGNLSGQLILNNGVDIPQTWVPGAPRALNLAAWPNGVRCKVLRPFGYFLVALNIREGMDQKRDRVRWSNPAVPGQLPTSWETGNPAVEAGQVDLSDDSAGEIIDGVKLRNYLIIYKNNSTHAMSFVGGQNVFAFTDVFPKLGALETNCVTAFSRRGGEFHCVFTGDDVIIHDGRVIEATLDGRHSRSIARELSGVSWRRSFVVNFAAVKENWICYPVGEAQFPNKALVWNYQDNTTVFIDLPENFHWITRGIVEGVQASLTWDSDTEVVTWDEDDEAWDTASVQQRNLRPVGFISQGAEKGITQLDVASSNEQVRTLLERTNFAYRPDRQTVQPIYDPGSEKLLRGVRLYLNPADAYNYVNVSVGVQNSVLEGEDLGDVRFIPAPFTDSLKNPRYQAKGEGRAFSLRIESDDPRPWELLGIEWDIEPKQSRWGGGVQEFDIRPGRRRRRTPFGSGRLL